jgi:hypothetical protein
MAAIRVSARQEFNFRDGGSVRKHMITVGSVFAAASLLLAGYVLLSNFSDIRRYIRISTM